MFLVASVRALLTLFPSYGDGLKFDELTRINASAWEQSY
jgi:hypothetical protein